MLKNLFISLLAAGSILAPANKATAFSLLGNFDARYQTADIGYGVDGIISSRETDLGGPMNLNEEYRWQSPVLVYGFDTTFKEYFGPAGVAAVEAAIKVFNDLPKASSMSTALTEFPLETSRYNYTAQQLQILDIKSLILSALLEQVGVACPERYTYTLRSRLPVAGGTDFAYVVIQRNFDPVPLNPMAPAHLWKYAYSPYVNGTLYTYVIRDWRTRNGIAEFWDAQEIAVDVANPHVSVAAYASLQLGLTDPRVQNQVYGSALSPGAGLFFSGLTREDAGALRYMLHPGRTNVEFSPPFSTRGQPVSGITVVDTRKGDSPWRIQVPGGVVLVPGTTNNGTVALPLIEPALRGGVDKINFVRLDVDSFLGRFVDPLIIRYTETVVDPFTMRPIVQPVQRTLNFPDLLFSASDLGIAPPNFPYVFSRQMTFVDNGAVNSAGSDIQAGPGNVQPFEIILSKLGPWSVNRNETPQEESSKGYIFGSFDGSTNAPIVFPEGVTTTELERRLFGQN